jgi:hypothetical protein
MSGKSKISAWGGYRTGSGRPRKKKTVSEKVKNNYIKAARKIAREKGITIEEHLLWMLFDDNVQDTVKASIMKSYNEAIISKELDQNANVNRHVGPVIGLPAMEEDPALKVMAGGNNKNRHAGNPIKVS